MSQPSHKQYKKSELLQSLLLQIVMMLQLLTQNVLVQTKIKSNVVHAGHSQLLLHSHKVDVYKVLIRHSSNTHKNTLLLVIQLIWVAMVVGYQWYGDS